MFQKLEDMKEKSQFGSDHLSGEAVTNVVGENPNLLKFANLIPKPEEENSHLWKKKMPKGGMLQKGSPHKNRDSRTGSCSPRSELSGSDRDEDYNISGGNSYNAEDDNVLACGVLGISPKRHMLLEHNDNGSPDGAGDAGEGGESPLRKKIDQTGICYQIL